MDRSDYIFETGWRWAKAGDGYPLANLPEIDNLGDRLTKQGYEIVHCYGVPVMGTVQVWQHDEPNHPAVVFFSMSDHYRVIYAPTTPDLIELLALLAPIATADLLSGFEDVVDVVGIIAREHPEYQTYQRQIQSSLARAKAKKQ